MIVISIVVIICSAIGSFIGCSIFVNLWFRKLARELKDAKGAKDANDVVMGRLEG